MSGIPNIARRSARRQATIDEIVQAAWELSRRHGLGNFSMRDLGALVGMRAQSLYSYFSSKHELYDAMFADGNRAFLDRLAGQPLPADRPPTLDELVDHARLFVRFCVEDPVRYQLLFQRTIPDFEPSAESYALAQQAYEASFASLRAIGIDGEGLDLATAVIGGLAMQQVANDPGGDRWERLVERAVRALLTELAPTLLTTTTGGTR